MYNVLEKVRGARPLPDGERWLSVAKPVRGNARTAPSSGPSGHLLPDGEKTNAPPLTSEEALIFDRALIATLKHLHDELDAAVADAYGWPRDLAEDEVLARLVALNADRAKEERAGKVRWLRPDYQIPRFGSVKERAELELIGGAGEGMTGEKEVKPAFPADDLAQTVAVTLALARADMALSAADIARGFKQGRKIEKKVDITLRALARMGELSSPDGARFLLRRAA